MEVPIEIPPGVVAKPTKGANSSNWRIANLMRWNGNILEPIGGWEKYGYTAPASNVRAVHSWIANNGRRWDAFLCEGHIYVDFDGALEDISPTPAITAWAPGAGGFGDLGYGESTYGTARAGAPQRKEIGPAFTVDNWGENLLFMTSADGRLLQWVPDTTAPVGDSTVVTNAPSGFTFVVTPERHVIIFDYAGNKGGFAWCDQEDITDWNYADITSKAGNHDIEPAAPIVAAKHVGEAGTLFFSTKRPYITSYVGLPYIYTDGIELSAGGIPISPQSLVRAKDGAAWLSQSGVWYFNGVSVLAVDCPIWPWIKDNINWDVARDYAIACNMTDHSEVWFFFPSSADSVKNDRLAIWGYKDGQEWWSMGKVSRSAAHTADFLGYPIMADGTDIYKHGSGDSFPGVSEKPYVETFPINVRGAADLITVNKIKPEISGDYANLRFSMAYRTKRTPDNEQYSAQRQLQTETGEVWMEVSGLEARLRIEYVGALRADFGVGPILFDVVARGKKT